MVDVAKHFVVLGANTKIRNSRGFTPLDLAERVGNKEILDVLRKAAETQKSEDQGSEKGTSGAIIKEYIEDAATGFLKKEIQP